MSVPLLYVGTDGALAGGGKEAWNRGWSWPMVLMVLYTLKAGCCGAEDRPGTPYMGRAGMAAKEIVLGGEYIGGPYTGRGMGSTPM